MAFKVNVCNVKVYIRRVTLSHQPRVRTNVQAKCRARLDDTIVRASEPKQSRKHGNNVCQCGIGTDVSR